MKKDLRVGSKVQIVYIFDHLKINQLTIMGFVGESFDFRRYLRLGIPHGLRIDYVSGSVPLNFIQDGNVIVHLRGRRKMPNPRKPHKHPRDAREQKHVKHSKHLQKPKPQHRSRSQAHRNRNHRHQQSGHKKARIIPVDYSYKNVSHILSTIGLSLEALGRAYNRRRH